MKGFLISLGVLCLALVMAIPCDAQQVTVVKKGPLGRVRSVTTVNNGIGFAPAQGFVPRAQFNSGFRPLRAILLPNGQVVFQ